MSQTQTKPLSVTAYATHTQRVVKTAGPAVVEGEVQMPRTTGGGALMFDVTDGESCLRCKVLPWTLRDGITHRPKEGDLVRLEISHPDFWPKGGMLTVVVEDIELAGDGELLKRRQQLLERLRAEGWTEASQFPPLPRFPRAVGVIAGVDSDALKDIIRGLGDRLPSARVVTAPCQVQGVGAPRAIIDALANLDLHPEVDVIVLSRGGGSVKDLAAFDDEGLCTAIRTIETPVVTAIGHTDNDPVCNHITHAAYVPRHAAERVVPDRAALRLELDQAQAVTVRAVKPLGRRTQEFDSHARILRGRDRVVISQRALAERAWVLDRAASKMTRIFNKVAELNQAGHETEVMAVLFDSPEWANNEGQFGRCGEPNTSDDEAVEPPNLGHIDAWGDFTRAFVATFGPAANPDYGLAAVEVWNEPNLAKFWGHTSQQEFDPDPERFARLVEASSDAVAAVPGAGGVKVFPGALSPKAGPGTAAATDTYMRAATDPSFPRAITPSMVNGISVHLYNNLKNSTTDREVRGDVQDKYERMLDGLRTGFHNKVRWITESVPSGGPDLRGVSGRKQKRRLRVAYWKYGADVETFVVHRLKDSSTGDEPTGFGVLTETGMLKGPNNGHDGGYCVLARRRDLVPIHPAC